MTKTIDKKLTPLRIDRSKSLLVTTMESQLAFLFYHCRGPLSSKGSYWDIAVDWGMSVDLRLTCMRNYGNFNQWLI